MSNARLEPTGAPRRALVVSIFGHRGVVALQPLAPGDVALSVTGVLVRRPSRTSIQVGEGEHMDVQPGLPAQEVEREYPWQFLNHACDANARLVGRDIVAVRAIAPGHEITFNYNATESELAAPFDCRCGARACRGERIAGFLHLAHEQRLALLPLLTDALRARLARESGLKPAANRG